jgi:hypothetical protein
LTKSLVSVQMMRHENAIPSERPLAHRTFVTFVTSLIAMYRYNKPIPTTVNTVVKRIDTFDTSATVPDSTIFFPKCVYPAASYLTVWLESRLS